MTSPTWRRPAAGLLAVAVALVLAACGGGDQGGGSTTAGGQPGKGKPPVTLGSKNFTEQFILGQLYKQALEAKGFKVVLKNNIGSSELVDKALTSGKIDLYPEYTGVIVGELKKVDPSKRPKSAEATYQEAKAFQAGRGLALLDKTPFVDADALAVKPEYAQKNGLKTIADLKKVPSFSLGGPPENRTRFQGVVGLKQVYKLDNLKFKPLAIGQQYPALKGGQIDVATVFTTDGQLQGSKYTILTDTEAIFGFQNVAPVVDKKVLAKEGPEFAKTLNAVSAKLSTEAMQKMNAAADINKQKPAAVATAFLKANGLK